MVRYDHGCLYAYQTQRFTSGTADERCRKNVEEAYTYLAQNRLPVILAGNWIGYVHDIGPADAKAPLRHDEPGYFAYLEQRLVAGLERIGAGERAVVLVKQPYSTGVDIAKCLSQPGVGESAKASRSVAQSRSHAMRSAAEADRMIENVVKRYPSIVTIDPKVVFCRDEVCKVSDEGALYFRDTGHLTNEGSLFMVEGVRETLLKLFRGKP